MIANRHTSPDTRPGLFYRVRGTVGLSSKQSDKAGNQEDFFFATRPDGAGERSDL